MLIVLSSAQDSASASAETSKGLYDELVVRHPDNMLALNHDTKGMYMLLTKPIPRPSIKTHLLPTDTTV